MGKLVHLDSKKKLCSKLPTPLAILISRKIEICKLTIDRNIISKDDDTE